MHTHRNSIICIFKLLNFYNYCKQQARKKRYLTQRKAKTCRLVFIATTRELPTLINFCLFNLKNACLSSMNLLLCVRMSVKWKIHKSSLSLHWQSELSFEIQQEPFLIKIKAANSNLGAPGEIRNSSPLQFQFTGTHNSERRSIFAALSGMAHNGAFRKAQNPLRWQEQKPCKYLQMDHVRRHSLVPAKQM
jgi:hypothetical protein